MWLILDYVSSFATLQNEIIFLFLWENEIMHCLLLLLSQPFYLYCCRREFSSCQAQSIFYSVDANSKILSEDERKVSITRKLHKGTYFHHGVTNLTFLQQKYPYFLWFEVVLEVIVGYNLTKLNSLQKISQKNLIPPPRILENRKCHRILERQKLQKSWKI